MTYRFVIEGVPRTKKTSNQGVVIPVKKDGRPVFGKDGKPKMRAMMFPAEEWREWVKDARIRYEAGLITFYQKRALLVMDGATTEWVPLGAPLNCRALVYLGNRQHGDTLGYLQGLADLLEARRVVENDRFLVTWDGSRCVHDGSVPRVDVTLEPAALTLD